MKRKRDMKLKPNEEQIQMMHKEGAKICKRTGHIWNKHYEGGWMEGKIKCLRCGQKKGGDDWSDLAIKRMVFNSWDIATM